MSSVDSEYELNQLNRDQTRSKLSNGERSLCDFLRIRLRSDKSFHSRLSQLPRFYIGLCLCARVRARVSYSEYVYVPCTMLWTYCSCNVLVLTVIENLIQRHFKGLF